MSSAQIDSSCLQHAGSTSTYIVLTNCTVSGSDCSHSKADCNCLVTSCFPTTTTFFFIFYFFCSIAIVQICVCILRWTLYREVLKHYKCASIKSFKIPIARCWTQMMLYMLWMLIGWQMNQSREETNSRNHQERKKFKKNQRLKRYQQGLLWTLCIVFNTRFHFSSLCVIPSRLEKATTRWVVAHRPVLPHILCTLSIHRCFLLSYPWTPNMLPLVNHNFSISCKEATFYLL